MKAQSKIVLSFIGGALLSFSIGQGYIQPSLVQKVNASEFAQSSFKSGSLASCEVFFSDDRDNFEDEINSRLAKAKLLQSNVLWSETTKQLGFYALICY